MNKNEFVNFFNEDKNEISRIYDKLMIAEQSGKCIFFNEFSHPGQWSKLLQLRSKFNVNIAVYGVFEEAERRIIAFYTNELGKYPIKLIKIINGSKFSKLEHKDYLGALMSLGVKREKLGDLIISDGNCYCAICEDVYGYIRENLETIGRCPCEVVEVIDLDDKPKFDFKEIVAISTSFRLDSIISALTGLSRSKAVSLISSSKVLLNYYEINEKDEVVPVNSVVTIRGYGKYRILDTVGNSNSGRLKIFVKKYI